MANLNQSYDFIKQIGSGGMATVFMAKHPALDRIVAVKVVKGEHRDKIRRFEREAVLSAQLKQENLPSIFDYFQDDLKNHYLVMEYVEGIDVSQVIKSKGALPPLICAIIAREICRGLEHMHEIGIIHRDIKPSNVRLGSNGQIKLMDFGIAKSEDEANQAQLTSTGVIVGTPSYMSPEQASGDKLTIQTDVFSLGTMLYEMLTGKKPFTADTNMTLISLIAQGKFTPLSESHPQLPKMLTEVVAKAMAKSTKARYQNVSEVIKALNGYLQSISQAEIRRWLTQYYEAATAKDKVPDMSVFALPEPVAELTATVTSKPSAGRKSLKKWVLVTVPAVLILGIASYAFWPEANPLGNYDPFGRMTLNLKGDRSTLRDTRIFVNEREFPLGDEFRGALLLDNFQKGRNAVRIRFPLLYQSYEYNFGLENSDDNKSLTLDLERLSGVMDQYRPDSKKIGFSVITEPAGASVTFDDMKSKSFVAKTPSGLTWPNLKSGGHKIFLQKDGYVTSGIERNFSDNDVTTIHFELEKKR